MEVRLRKDSMKAEVKLACLKELHPNCFYLIENSSSRESLKVGCSECREKYRGIVEEKLKAPAKLKKPRATRRYLLERVIWLERKSALLEREVEELKKEGR
jgi:hypothetical protein